MKNASTRFLALLLAMLLAVPLSGLAQPEAPKGTTNVLIIVSLDKSCPRRVKPMAWGTT